MKLTCPFCYESFDSSRIKYRCENLNDAACPKEDDLRLANYFGRGNYPAKRIIAASPVGSGFMGLWKKAATSVNCDKCKKPSTKRVCPECHNQLPTLFHQAQSHIISIIGARNSGKTHFITVLINELIRRGYPLKLKTVPQDVGEDRNEVTSIRYKNQYKRPLIDNLTELPQTQPNARDLYPLIYQIESREKGYARKNVLYLTFYDTAGENFRDEQEIRKLANYVSNSSGVIFLIDTFQIPAVKAHLQKKGLKLPELATDYHDVLHKVFSLFEKQGYIKEVGKLANIPIAITLSKFDEVLRKDLLSGAIPYRGVQENSSYLRTGKYSDKEIDEVSKVIRFNLENHWDEGGFVHDLAATFRNHKYFGVSALGDTPVHGKLTQGQVMPLRVMDPLLWILDKLNFALPKAK